MENNIITIRKVNIYLTKEQNEIMNILLSSEDSLVFKKINKNNNVSLLILFENLVLDYYQIDIKDFGIIEINRLVNFGEILLKNHLDNQEGNFQLYSLQIDKIKNEWKGVLIFERISVKKKKPASRIRKVYTYKNKKSKKVYNDSCIFITEKVKPRILSGGLPSLGKKRK